MKRFAIGILVFFLAIPNFLSAQYILQRSEVSEAEKKAIDAQAEVMSAILRLYAEEALLRPEDLAAAKLRSRFLEKDRRNRCSLK